MDIVSTISVTIGSIFFVVMFGWIAKEGWKRRKDQGGGRKRNDDQYTVIAR